MPISVPLLESFKKLPTAITTPNNDTFVEQKKLKIASGIAPAKKKDKYDEEIQEICKAFEVEYQYWLNLSSTATSAEEKDRAKLYHEIFFNLREEILVFHLLPPLKVMLVLDQMETCLGTLVAESLPKPHLDACLATLTDLVRVYATSKAPLLPAIATATSVPRLCQLLEPSVTLLEKWNQTLQFYPPPTGPWAAFMAFFEKIFEINDIVACLLASVHAGAAVDCPQLLAPLASLEWHSEPSLWQGAIKQIEYLIQPCESFLAVNIKKTMEEDENLLYRNWTKYISIMKRPKIKKELLTERKIMRAQIKADFESIDAKLRDFSITACTLSDTVADRLMWLQQSQERIRECDLMIQCIDLEIEGYQLKRQQLQEEMASCRRHLLDEFQESAMQLETQIRGNQQMVSMQLKLGKLQVMYPDELGALVKQVRQLIAMRFALHPTILRLAEEAQKHFKTAVVLRQIAHFYNTVESQILPFHKPLLLPAIEHFEKQIKQSINWKDLQRVQMYIQTLYDAANALQTQTNDLQSVHHTIITIQLKMLHFPGETQWKSGLQEIHQLLGAQLWPEEQLVPWKVHLQWQLYKIIRHNYAYNLKSYALPEMKLDVVAKNGHVVLRPPLEEVKTKYYREIKKRISQPTTFPGLIQQQLGYFDIVEANAQHLLAIYQKAEEVFEQLDKKLEGLKEWVFLGALSNEKLMEYISTYTTQMQDWEAHFKLLKAKGKEAEALGNSFKIDTLTCSLLPLKAFIDDYLQRLFDALVQCLYKSIQAHAKKVEDFLSHGIHLVSMAPTSVKELAKAKQLKSELHVGDMESEMSQMQAKRKVFRGVTGNSPEIGDLAARYAQFELMIKGHDMLMHDHHQQLHAQMQARVEKVQVQMERLHEQCAKLSGDTQADRLDEYLEQVLELEGKVDELTSDCVYFEMSVPNLDQFHELRETLQQAYDARELLRTFQTSLQPFLDTTLAFLQLDELRDVLRSWKEKLAGQAVGRTNLEVFKQIDALWALQEAWMTYFREVKSYTSQHWDEFCQLLGILPVTHKVTLGSLVSRVGMLSTRADALIELGMRAKNELVIREALQEIEMWSVSCVLQCNHTTTAQGTQVSLLKDLKKTFSELGDQRAAVSSLQQTPNNAAFIEMLSYWDQRLAQLDQCLRQLLAVQRKWMYLGPVIQALPAPQQQKFAQVDHQFQEIMRRVAQDPKAIQLLNQHQIHQQLPTMVQTLETCQKALLDYLELKRNAFPRFYFIGDEDLLEILSQSNSNPLIVQAHLKKLFSGIHKVKMEGNEVTHILSAKGESVKLEKPVTVSDQVDGWLSALNSEIQRTLQHLLSECIQIDAEADKAKFSAYPEQIRDLVYRIQMTQKIETAIQSQSLPALLASLKTNSYDAIYYARVVQELIHAKVQHTKEFPWMKLLRYYYVDSSCRLCIFDGRFDYTFEYQGNPNKLVQSPLTDNCFATLGQAMSEGLGGCLYGPAGTGKTESVKHLGYLFGRQVLVFNCDEGLDVNSIVRLFCGLVKCGAWGCFDEFNRLSSSVLAAVSNLVGTIQHALFHKLPTIVLSGNQVELHPSASLFVTLNPVGKEYKGRQRLPDNLKQLFRNMAMTHPDIVYICQIELKALGFKVADMLGTLVVSFFQACKNILSPQKHYDWGLRALKAVLFTAGELRRTFAEADEINLMMQSMKSNTESKLTGPDLTFFQILLSAYFKSSQVPAALEGFEKALDQAYTELNLSPSLPWQRKAATQFHIACKQRMGVCLVGPPASGKATLVKLVAHARNQLEKPTKIFWISPKAMNRTQLLGYLDSVTREWHDGVVTVYARETINAPDWHYYLAFDGDIDPEWIEALNSVLDDNRLLTMPNGERVKFEGNVNFVFVTDSLTLASPATVTRLGIIYLDQLIPKELKVCPSLCNDPVMRAPLMGTSRDTLVLGDLGTGRKKHIQKLYEKQFLLWIQCSMQSNSEELVHLILQHTTLVTHLQGQTLIPKSGVSTIVAVFCDLDLPVKDKYQTVQVHQFLHQLMKHKGFHHPKSLEWIHCTCLQVVSSASAIEKLEKRLATKFESEKLPLPSVDECSDFILPSLRECGMDMKLIPKFNAVFGKVMQKTESFLCIRKWVRALVHTMLSTADQQQQQQTWSASFPLELLFLHLGLQCFPQALESVRLAVQSEFRIPSFSLQLSESLSSTLKDKYDAMFTFPQVQDLIQSFFIALSHALPIVHLKASPGIPVHDVLHLLSNDMLVPLIFINYTKVASLNAFWLQLKEVLALTGVQNKKAILVLDAHNCPSPDYYHAIHQVYSLHVTHDIIMPDSAEAEQAYHAATFVGTLQTFVLTRAIVNLKLVILNMPEEWLTGFPNFISKGVFLKCEDWNDTTRSLLTQHLDPNLASGLLQMYQHPPTEATPRCLTHILQLFASLHRELSSKMEKRYTYLKRGLSKLTLTTTSVGLLSKDAAEQEFALQDKQKLADATLKKITETMLEASNQKLEMEQLSSRLQGEEGVIEEQKKVIQAELDQVEPLIQQAKSAVSEIKSEHLSEVRSLRSPPVTVRDVLEGVLTLLGQQDLSWSSMKSVLGKRSFKEDILNFNAASITSSIRVQLEKLLREKPDSFVEANVRKSSVAAAPLANWIIANLEFSKVLEKVKPLQTKLDQLNRSLEKSKDRIREIMDAMASVDEKVDQLKLDFASKTGEAQKLADKLATTQANLDRAHHLLHTLSAEENRWQNDMQQLETKLSRLNAIALCSAVYAVWATPLNEEGRKKLAESCTAALNLDGFNFSELMDADEEMEWEDSISLDNVLATTFSNQVTYWIADGNGKGLPHLKAFYEKQRQRGSGSGSDGVAPFLKTVSVQSESYVKELEMAIRLGHHVLLMDVQVDDPHAWLFPILRHDYQKVHGRCMLSLKSNKQLEVHPQFKLILYTPYAGWSLPSSLKGHVVQLCWSTTAHGLQAILLHSITLADAPEMLAKLDTLNRQERHLKRELVVVENQMLEELNKSDEGLDLLSNQKLLDSLLHAKSKGQTVSESLSASRQVQDEIKAQQAHYQHLLKDLSEIYFIVRKLFWMDPNYRYNLHTYVDWFKQVLAQHPKTTTATTGNTPARLKTILASMVQTVFQQTALCMDPLHQFALALVLLSILKVIPHVELQSLCGLDDPAAGGGANPKLPKWVPDTKRTRLSALCLLFDVSNLLHQGSEDAWRQWMERRVDAIPCQCTAFQHLLLTSALSPDALFARCADLIASNFPASLASNTLAKAYLAASQVRPVLLFVPPGAHPLRDLDLAALGRPAPQTVSLGEGVQHLAVAAMERVLREGGSLFLQNLQALPSFVPVCTALLSSALSGGDRMHPGCLLILSCETHTLQLPVELLELCVLVRVQGVSGFYTHLHHLLSTAEQQKQDPLPPSPASATAAAPKDSSPGTRLQKLFLVAWFHVLVQERRRFVPQAWRTSYEFGMTDFQSIVKLLDRDFPTLRGLIQLIYGGKVDVPVDAHKLTLLVHAIIDEDVLEREGKMPLRKLVRGFAIPPPTTQVQDFLRAIDVLREIKEHWLLQLPPNVYATVDGFKIKTVLDNTKLLLMGSSGAGPVPSSAPLSSTSSSLASTEAASMLTTFVQHWKKTFQSFPKPATVSLPKQQAPAECSSPILLFLQSQYDALALHVAAVESRITGPRVLHDKDLLHALSLNATPAPWLDWAAQPNLQHYPVSLKSTCETLLQYLTTYARQQQQQQVAGEGLLLLHPIPLHTLRSPSGLLSIWQAMTVHRAQRAEAASASVSARAGVPWVSDLTLLASFSKTQWPDDALVAEVYVQGALVERGRLLHPAEVTYGTPALQKCTVYLKWSDTHTQNAASSLSSSLKRGVVQVPLYKETSREVHVADLSVVMEERMDHAALTLAGVALFTHPS